MTTDELSRRFFDEDEPHNPEQLPAVQKPARKRKVQPTPPQEETDDFNENEGEENPNITPPLVLPSFDILAPTDCESTNDDTSLVSSELSVSNNVLSNLSKCWKLVSTPEEACKLALTTMKTLRERRETVRPTIREINPRPPSTDPYTPY